MFDRMVSLCGMSFLFAAACVVQLVHAQDELPCPPPVGGRVVFGDHPILSKLPLAPDYLHRVIANDQGEITIFLKKMPQAEIVLPGTCTSQAGCEKISSKILAAPCEVETERHIGLFTARFLRQGCPCTATGECACASHATCGQECAAAKAGSCNCCPCAAHAEEATCGEESCKAKDILIHRTQHVEHLAEHDPLKLMHHIAGLVGEKAAAQAALAVHKEADDQISELVETMAGLFADNAALDAKLEAQNESHAEQRKLLEKVADLAAENARLKAHVELAAERAELARGSAALTLENERLKLRVAELEQKHALAEAARTAAKPKERKAR
jgi:hypothetical protein